MPTDWTTRFSRTVERFVPDAITASIFFLLLLAVAALATGNSPETTMEAYYKGLWMLLPFTMQMTLIVVLGRVLGSTPLFKSAVRRLSLLPRTRGQVVALSLLVVAVLSYFYWGLGIALGPLTAIYFCREAERKGIPIDFPFLLAANMAAQSVWQYGLSATNALMMATPGHFLEATTGVMTFRTTIWTPAAIAQEIGYALGLICITWALMPRERRSVSDFPDAYRLADPEEPAGAGDRGVSLTHSERLERYSSLTLLLGLALALWVYYHFAVKRLGLDLNSLNTLFLLLCLLLHRNVHRFTKALQEAIGSSWPVVVTYHLYSGIAGLLQYTTLGESIAEIAAAWSTRYTFPLLAAVAGTAVAIFVPSTGGQWVIQGFVTVRAAGAVGVTAQRGMLALGVGDQMGNLISPFWYVVMAGIARVDFRRFFGYGLLFAAVWFVLGVLAFTFLPC
jgi:short-chain fatty acids transporter